MPSSGAADAFRLLPAIDLLDGRVVRLERGDFAKETAFSDDPVAVGEAFVAAGATWLHVVDLDGARTGTPAHDEAVRAIVESADGRAAVELAGGLRSAPGVEKALALGAARVVVGTRAVSEPAFAEELVRRHTSERIVVALDVRDGRALGRGWVEGIVGPPVEDVLRALLEVGVVWFEVTAIERDGMMGGPDIELLERVGRDSRARIIAAGGIATVAHVLAVRAIGCAGAIVGRALYDGSLAIEDALAAAAT